MWQVVENKAATKALPPTYGKGKQLQRRGNDKSHSELLLVTAMGDLISPDWSGEVRKYPKNR